MQNLAGLLMVLLAGAAAVPDDSAPAVEPDPRAIVNSMEEAAAQLRSYTMTMVRQERLKGKLIPAETVELKWSLPQKMYVRYVEPHPGREAIYVRGWNEDRLRVHKGSFPDINLNINPRGSLAMGGGHHPASESNLVSFVELVADGVRKSEARGEGTLRWTGEAVLWGRPCHRLEMISPPGGTLDTLRPGETLWDVARRNDADMYSILHHNLDRGWRKATHPRAGDQVFVPHYYAGRVLLWVDRENRLPIKAVIYDHEGELYESYEHRDLRVNPRLTDRDFDPDNPAYDF